MPVKTKKNLVNYLQRRRQAQATQQQEKLNNTTAANARAVTPKNMEPTVAAANAVAAAKRAYYETGKSILTDDAYDILETAALREGDIEEDVGIKPEKGGVLLPVPMTSLKKIKPGEDGLRRFLAGGHKWIVSEKLDGISALWHIDAAGVQRLYLRGDAYIGTDVSQYIPHIKGLLRGGIKGGLTVRGELVLRKEDASPGTPARSQVNGWLHKAIQPGAAKQLPVRFVAYQLITPSLTTRREQMTALERMGFEVAWYTVRNTLAEADCVELFKARREASTYDTDGIVIAPEGAPAAIPVGAAYPTDMVAFKMPSADQIADTRVVRVEWNITRLGVLSPRVEIEPVIIGGARITFVTGHNAKFIEANRIGPGAVVRIRRSGDVIPIIDTVLDGVDPQMPTQGTWIWKGVHAAVVSDEEAGAALEKLKYAFKVLEVDGAGGATVEAAWRELGLRSISDVIVADTESLKVLGKTIGPRLQERLKARLAVAPMNRKLVATCLLPPGIGLTRLDKLPTSTGPSGWLTLPIPSGWGADAWASFILVLPDAIKQVNEWNSLLGISTASLPAQLAAQVPVPVEQKGEIVFTGFRDKAWEEGLRASGWITVDTMKKTVKALIIADSEDPATYKSGKADKARQYGIPIIRKSDWAMAAKE